MKRVWVAGVMGLLALGGCQTARDVRAQLVREPPVCRQVTVPIYFAPGQARMTPDGRRLLTEAAGRARWTRL